MKKSTIIFLLLLGWNLFILLFGIFQKTIHSPFADLMILVGKIAVVLVLVIYALLKWVFKVIK